jgi:uncharacterized damage-inducible protein DinB
MNPANELIEQSIIRFDEYTSKIERCMMELSESELWKRPNESSNSVGNLILHLCGNIRQYIISSLGNKADQRKRDEEFLTDGGYKKYELLQNLNEIITQAKAVLTNIDDKELFRVRSVQGFKLSGIGIVIHVVEHFSYHTGQIVFWTKLLHNTDLRFYNNEDLNQKNKLDK